MAVQEHPLAGEAQHRVAPGRVDPLVAVDVVDEAVDPVRFQRVRQPVPVAQRLSA